MLAGTQIGPVKGVKLQPIVFKLCDLLYYLLNNITPPKNSIIESVYVSTKTENYISLCPGAVADYDDARHKNKFFLTKTMSVFWQ